MIKLASGEIVVPKASISKSALLVIFDKKALKPGRNNISIEVLDDKGDVVDRVNTAFLAPENLDELK
ncbi:MAG TPA: hypothetical protein ENJ15_07915 [Caldithrix abyssi]|uniref:Uncharacterized protein n=1 Tax=Caldithrix abyssi TaxID=187145 RepID=A0A7V5RQK5_CALAY|nr:hypothetical protein [Caldithrix abyssi]